ncbi:MAG: DUF3592 domain-containing protein [Sphingosinicella sp.]|uniref:DUF3592 domain-containing protein n=1 Tax=Sphingosinicella sp. TaxID=1917971 RepID=UPI00403805F5
MRNTTITVWVLGIAGLLLIALGAALIVRDRAQLAEARDWPSVEGRITSGYVATQRGSGRTRTRYFPRIEYSYSVEGRTYSNHYIWLTSSRGFSTEDGARQVLRTYPVGSIVPVFYAPADPQRSALEVEGETGALTILVVVGLALLGIAFWLRRKVAPRP